MGLKLKKVGVLVGAVFLSTNALSATIDGAIVQGSSEYQASTDGVEGSAKWHSQGNYSGDIDLDDYQNGQNHEYDDASTGDKWDINYLGTSVVGSKFQFGAVGGSILSGRETDANIYLGDFAISVNGYTDPTINSKGFDYAIRVLGVDDQTGVAQFSLLQGGVWEEADIYNGLSGHTSETYRMSNSNGRLEEILSFNGNWTSNGGDDNVLEGEFDLSYLSLFDASTGGTISTYLTMACVNDEAIVDMSVPSAVPIPAALWLLSPALIGLLGMRRKYT